MRPGTVWWMQIGNSIRFLDDIVNALRNWRSVILDMCQPLPWREDLDEAIDQRRASDTGNRRLIRKAWREGSDPGRFLLEKICTDEEQANYFPGMSVAHYLNTTPNISIHNYYIWITSIHNKADIKKWIEFISEHEKYARASEKHATYVLEYDGPMVSFKNVECIRYSIEKYDCRIFAMAAAAAVKNTQYIGYQTQLALSISNDDPQLCWDLIKCGNALLIDPERTIQQQVAKLDVALDLKTTKSRIWEAGLIQLFPRIEQYRSMFATKYSAALSSYLPIDNGYGEKILAPEDLEIGNIWYIINQNHGLCDHEEYLSIKLCRDVRNILAHNKTVPFVLIEKLYTLYLKTI